MTRARHPCREDPSPLSKRQSGGTRTINLTDLLAIRDAGTGPGSYLGFAHHEIVGLPNQTPIGTWRRTPVNRKLLCRLGSLCFCCLLLVNSPGLAAVFTWNNPNGGDFGTTTNWTPNGLPGSADTVTLNLAGTTYTVTTSASENIDGLQIGNNNVTLNLEGNTLNTLGPYNSSSDVFGLSPTDNTDVTITNGTLMTYFDIIGGYQGMQA